MVRTYLGWMRFVPFIELVMGLLVWIHYHHGWYRQLTEKMEYMERSLRSLFHVVRAMCCGVIMWNSWGILRRIYPSIVQSSIHMYIHTYIHIYIYIYIYSSIHLVVHEGTLDWITSLLKEEWCRLFSLDVVCPWTTSKDALSLVDPHQLPPHPCVVYHCGDTWHLLTPSSTS